MGLLKSVHAHSHCALWIILSQSVQYVEQFYDRNNNFLLMQLFRYFFLCMIRSHWSILLEQVVVGIREWLYTSFQFSEY